MGDQEFIVYVDIDYATLSHSIDVYGDGSWCMYVFQSTLVSIIFGVQCIRQKTSKTGNLNIAMTDCII